MRTSRVLEHVWLGRNMLLGHAPVPIELTIAITVFFGRRRWNETVLELL